MATNRVTITKGGTQKTIDFVVPETVGTYNIKATMEDGTVLNGGNIVVNGKANRYQLRFGMPDGSTINAGTIETPIVYCKVSYPTMPTGVKRYFIQNNSNMDSTYYVDTPTSAGEISVPYGTELCIASYESDGYNKPSINGGEWLEIITVTNDTTITVTAGSVKSYMLTIPALPTGVESLSITRTPTLLGVPEAQTFIAPGYEVYKVIYHGDTLTITAIPVPGYGEPTATLSKTSVTGNVIATVTAGVEAYKLYYPAVTGTISGDNPQWRVWITRNNVSSIFIENPTTEGIATIYPGDKLSIYFSALPNGSPTVALSRNAAFNVVLNGTTGVSLFNGIDSQWTVDNDDLAVIINSEDKHNLKLHSSITAVY